MTRLINSEATFSWDQLCVVAHAVENEVARLKEMLVAHEYIPVRLSDQMMLASMLTAYSEACSLLDYVMPDNDKKKALELNVDPEDVARIQKLIDEHHHPELAKVDGGMVTQVWQDAEVTSTKCGDLLGRRSLHCLAIGIPNFKVDGLNWPKSSGDNSFIYTNERGKNILRDALLSAFLKSVQK